jgi:hypothetical protein
MSPYAELHADAQFGEVGYHLLFGLVRQELRRFPGLQYGVGDDDVWDAVGDFLAERGRGVSVMLLATATDDDSFAALLRTSLRHWLVDQVRKTDLGALRRRLERLVRDDDRFEVVPAGVPGAGWWRLAGTGTAPAGPPLADLRDAAWEVRGIRVLPWSSEERRAPAADSGSLGRIVAAVWAGTGDSLPPATVTAVFAHRLPNALDPSEEPLASEDAAGLATAPGPEADPAESFIAGEVAADAAWAARAFYAQMSPAERRLLPSLDGTPGEQADATGLGRTQTYRHVSALKARLRALLGDEGEEERILVMCELRGLCGVPADHATRDGGAGVPSTRGRR